MLNHYTYTYDGYGNITAIEGTETASEGIDKLTGAKMTYGADNRLLTYNGAELQYDAEGNMTYGPINGVMSTLTYDCRNRLVSAGGITYAYDAENNRISAETDTYLEEYVTDTVSSSLSRVLTATRYEKQKDASGKETLDAGSTTTYYYGTGLISETKGDITLYHHYNHLGSTMKLTDSDGNVVETYTYGTYGELLSGDATLTRFLYNGEMGVSTDDNGLFYMRQRYYNPEIKRFVNQDILTGTLDNSQSLNRYCYVQGNPVSYVDPFGLSPLSTPEGRHTIFGLLGCIPVIGIVFNGIDAYYYFKEGDIGMGLWSIVAMGSDGAALAGKAAMGTANVFKAANQGAKAQKYARMAVTAQKIHHGAELVSNGVNFLKNGSMAVENAGEIYTKLADGEKVGFGEWMELGANVLGMGMSAGFGYKNAQGLKAARQTDVTGLLKESLAQHDYRGADSNIPQKGYTLKYNLQFFGGSSKGNELSLFEKIKIKITKEIDINRISYNPADDVFKRGFVPESVSYHRKYYGENGRFDTSAEPIVVYDVGGGNYMMQGGHHRLKAAHDLNLKTIKVDNIIPYAESVRLGITNYPLNQIPK